MNFGSADNVFFTVIKKASSFRRWPFYLFGIPKE
jgi:hypothetical protein